ncbi:phosphotyrosine protein [Boletus reticuloceps]|uniref:Phosphotyrosine protein n=1 Tax=Boletus reticuloceps TaxID=495285 RepID=A0A8I3ABX6_9AGAM|nr:phosphotyrosine protein [Boletus reticuloceps]KAG6379688.1 phosphotyrosine protein [Boletus reticuloceps]
MWYIQTSQPASSSSPPPPPNGPSPITQTPYPLRPPSASEIIPHFYVSDLAFAENPAALASLGITHVLSAMRGYVALPPLHPPLHCAQFPLDDLPFSELVAHLPHMTAFLHGNHGPERARARTLRRGLSAPPTSSPPCVATLHPPLHRAQFPLDDLPFSELVAYLPHTTAFLHGTHGPERARARTLRRGLQFVKSRRRAAEPNFGVVKQLQEYAESFGRS